VQVNRYVPLSFVCALLACLTSCHSSTEWDPWSQVPTDLFSVRLPYVEDVILPQTVYAGEGFGVTLRVSSALDAGLLKGDMRAKQLGRLKPFSAVKGEGWLIEPWLIPLASDADSQTDEITFLVEPGLRVGVRKLGIASPRSRERGGMTVQVKCYSPGTGLPSDPVFTDAASISDVEIRVYSITVVARPR